VCCGVLRTLPLNLCDRKCSGPTQNNWKSEPSSQKERKVAGVRDTASYSRIDLYTHPLRPSAVLRVETVVVE
jgi:hypothetical protein